MINQRLFPHLLLGTVVLLCLGMAPSAAHGAPPAAGEVGLSYSTDGVNYSSSPPQLFSSMPRFVPGDEAHARLWIRNARADAVDISVQLSRSDGSGLTLTPSHSGMTGLDAGTLSAISLWASLPLTASNRTQNQTTDNLRLRLNAQAAVQEANTPPVSPGELGETRFASGIFSLILGKLGVDGVLYAKSRRRTNQEPTMEGDQS